MLFSLTVFIVIIMVLAGIIMVPIGLPGTWVIVLASGLYSIFYTFDGGETSRLWVNGALIIVALFGELMEFGVGTFGSKTLNVSNGAVLSAFIGGIVGLIIGVPVFLIGSLIGLLIGAFLGAFIHELFVLKKIGRAFVTACAVLATRLVASLLKTILALGMSVFLLFKIF